MKKIPNEILKDFFNLDGVDIKPIEIGSDVNTFDRDTAKYKFKPTLGARLANAIRGTGRKIQRACGRGA